MAEAYSAAADDTYALYYNPAGVVELAQPEIGTFYSQLYPGLSDDSRISRTFIGAASPVGERGALGLSYLSLQLNGLYKEEAAGVTGAMRLGPTLNAGLTAKMLRKKFGGDAYTGNAVNPLTGATIGSADPLLAASNEKSGLGLDAGIQWKPSPYYALGLAARNVNRPDLALGGGEDKAPAVFALALARRSRMNTLGMEATTWSSDERHSRLSIGGEHWFGSGFGLRLGGAVGSNNRADVSIGAAYRMDFLQFDYATIYPLQSVDSTLGMQQVSLTVRFGRREVDPIENELAREREQRLKAEADARAARTERDRLREELYLMTAKNPGDGRNFAREMAAAAKTDDPDSARYKAALGSYAIKVDRGMSLKDRRRAMEWLIEEFAPRKVDVSFARQELRRVRDDEGRIQNDFKMSMSFYKRIVQQGASRPERIGMLERIIQKYRSSGVDVSEAENELKKLP